MDKTCRENDKKWARQFQKKNLGKHYFFLVENNRSKSPSPNTRVLNSALT